MSPELRKILFIVAAICFNLAVMAAIFVALLFVLSPVLNYVQGSAALASLVFIFILGATAVLSFLIYAKALKRFADKINPK